MNPPTSSKSITPSPSTSTVPPALQHSPSPPRLQRNSAGGGGGGGVGESGQRGKVSPLRRPSGHKLVGGGGGAPSTSPVALKNALQQKEEVKRLAQRLATRLQYAAFKVERGWTKHSLPEVENLYWRATKLESSNPTHSGVTWKDHSSPREKSGTASSSSGMVQSASLDLKARAPSQASSRPAVVHQPSHSRGTKRPRPSVDVAGTEGSVDVEEDVFGSNAIISRPGGVLAPARHHAATTVIGPNGMPTPPPSAGTDLVKLGGRSASSSSSSSFTSAGAISTTMGRSMLADLRISPTRQMQAVRAASASVGASGAGGNGRSGVESQGLGQSQGQSAGTSTTAGSSYADFWNKMGSTSSSSSSSPATGSGNGSGSVVILGNGNGGGAGLKSVKRMREVDALGRGLGKKEEEEDEQAQDATRHVKSTKTSTAATATASIVK